MAFHKGSFIIGIILLMFSAPFTIIGFLYTFNPPDSAVIVVNDIERYPGESEFIFGSIIFLIIGLAFLIFSFGVIIFSLFGKQRFDVPRSTLDYGGDLTTSAYRSSAYKSSKSTYFSSSSRQTYCKSCGSLVRPKEKFCNNCGKKF